MNIPRPPEAFSSQSRLGGSIETYPLRKGRRWASLVMVLVLLAGSASVKAYGLYLAYLGWKRYGAAVVGEALFWPLVVAAGLFLLSLIFAGSAYANWVKVILLYRDGFAYKDRRGLHLWRWRDVTALRMAAIRHDVFGIHTGTIHTYTIENRNGNRLVLNDGFSRVEELAQVIEEKTFPILFEQAAQQYNAGQTLTFGPLWVDKAGIQISGKNYAWDEIQLVTVQRGYLRIARKDGGLFGGAKIAVAGIPNLRVLLSIIRQMASVKIE